MKLSVISNRESEHVHVVSDPTPINLGCRFADKPNGVRLLTSRTQVKSIEDADKVILEKTGRSPVWRLIDAHFRWSGKPDRWEHTDQVSGAVYKLTAD